MVQFRLGRIGVRIHVAFLFSVMILFMGVDSPAAFGIMCAVAAATVLLHELGHAFAGMAYGLIPRIELMAMGGQTSFQDPSDVGPSRRSFEDTVRARPVREVVIALAGSVVSLLAAVLLGAALRVLQARGVSAEGLAMVRLAAWINVGWGVFNLLPVLPLDGGRIMASLMVVFRVRDAERRAMFASMVLGIAFALSLLAAKVVIGAIIMLLLAWRNFQARSVTGALKSETDLVTYLADARKALDARDGRTMIHLAETVLAKSRTREVRSEALRILAYGQFLEGHWSSLLRLVDELGNEIGAPELIKLAKAATEVGRPEEAERIRAVAARMP